MMFQIRESRINRKHFSVKTLVSTYLEYFSQLHDFSGYSVSPQDSERLMKVWGWGVLSPPVF